MKKVLDHGYVDLVQHMGKDVTVPNAARVSFDRRAEHYGPKERGLVAFLFKDSHWSTVRHNVATFEVSAPLMVARQWWKYAVSSAHVEDQRGWNEVSRRYVTIEPQFYIPADDQWRTAPENMKQGSAEPLPARVYDSSRFDSGEAWTRELELFLASARGLYDKAMSHGIAPELARLFLPAYGMYVRWYWTCSFQTLVHFFGERLASDAQHEIHDFAQTVYDETADVWPNLMAELKLT